MQIEALDPGIKLFMREKMAEGNTTFTDQNVVLFLHGATSPSVCDFDLGYRDYSWADWLVKKGYVVYMGDYRNYGGSTREPVMDEPASKNPPATRSYLALRDVEAMVNRHQGEARCQASDYHWLVMGRDDGRVITLPCTRRMCENSFFMPRSTTSTTTPISGPAALYRTNVSPTNSISRLAPIVPYRRRQHGPLERRDPCREQRRYRDPAVPAEFWKACLATDPTSNSRTPPSVRAPNGVLEDSFYQATGRPLWNAANIYVRRSSSAAIMIAGPIARTAKD